MFDALAAEGRFPHFTAMARRIAELSLRSFLELLPSPGGPRSAGPAGCAALRSAASPQPSWGARAFRRNGLPSRVLRWTGARTGSGFATLLCAALLSATGAQAQTTTLVSNTGQTSQPASQFVSASLAGPNDILHGQRFTTGANEAGWSLSEVVAALGDVASGAVVKVSIYSDSSGSPGSLVHSLTNPTTVSSNAENTFTAPMTATLSGNTSYWVVFEEEDTGSSAYRVQTTGSPNEDSGATSGWSIANDRHSSFASSWSLASTGSILKIAIKGARLVSTDAKLSDLRLSHDGDDIELSPAFAPDDGLYTATVAGANEVTVTPTTSSRVATYEFRNADDTAPVADANPGVGGFQLRLSDGLHSITVKVTAEDGTTTTLYQINVTSIPGVSISLEERTRGGDAIARIDVVRFKVERTGTAAAALSVEVQLSQEGVSLYTGDLKRTVTIPAGDSSRLLILGGDSFNDSSGRGILTATVAEDPVGTDYGPVAPTSAEVTMVGTSGVPIYAVMDDDGWIVDEGAGTVEMELSLYVANGLPRPDTPISIAVVTREYNEDEFAGSRAIPKDDYETTERDFSFVWSDFVDQLPDVPWERTGSWVATKTFSVPIKEDTEREEDEYFMVIPQSAPATPSAVQFVWPSGVDCYSYIERFDDDCVHYVRIRDNDGPNAPLEAYLRNVPAAHDGETPFKFELAFNIAPDTKNFTPSQVLDVVGGTATGSTTVDQKPHKRWKITVEPAGSDDVTISTPVRTDCTRFDTACTADGRMLLLVPDPVTVSPGPPLTADLSGLPRTYDGRSEFTFELAFSIPPDLEASEVPGIFTVTGGTVTGARQLDPPGDATRWEVTVEPDGNAGVSIELPATTDCADEGAVCTADGRLLSQVPNPMTVSWVAPPMTACGVIPFGEEELLCTTLTVGTDVTPIPAGGEQHNTGYNGSSFGTLDENTFTDGDDPYTVANLFIGEARNAGGTIVSREFRLGFQAFRDEDGFLTSGPLQALHRRLTLHLDGNRFVPEEADFNNLDGRSQIYLFSWNNPGLTWIVGQQVQVRFTASTGAEGRSVERQVPFAAQLKDVPPSHDGSAAFAFELAFNDEPDLEAKEVPGILTVTGGTPTGARQLDKRSTRRWEVTVKPSSDADVSIMLGPTTDCSAAGAVCTANGRMLSVGFGEQVLGPDSRVPREPTEPPLTVAFHDLPASHDGTTPVVFQLEFSEEPASGYSFQTLRKKTLRVYQDGRRPRVRVSRLASPSNQSWEVTLTPKSGADMLVEIGPTADCSESGAVCTENGRKLSNEISRIISGPPSLAVADAKVTEAAGATVDFVVTLSSAASETVTVDYATSDGTATAGSDYTETSGTLTFAVGDTSKTVSVPVLDDSIDEGSETFTLTLSNVSGANVWLKDATATGTIENDDPMPHAWLSRLGRTVAGQAVDAIGARMEGAGGSHITVGGMQLDSAGNIVEPAEDGLVPDFESLRWNPVDETRSMTTREMLLGSSFRLGAGGEQGAPSWTGWGNFVTGGFEADVDETRMDADVTTGFLGADVGRDRWLAGLAVSFTEADGGFSLIEGDDRGEVESSLTALYPYAKIGLNERVDVWGLAGFGSGELEMTLLKDADRSEDEVYTTDIGMRMGALGVRGQVLSPSESGGLSIAVKSDAFWVRMDSDALDATDEHGRLEAAEADASRVRLIVESSRAFDTGNGVLTPSAEVGVRYDGGDAETGTGVEVGGGLRYQRAGVSIEGKVRTLVAHEESGYEEWGASGSVRVQPSDSGRGLSFTLTPAWGAASSGVERLLGPSRTHVDLSNGCRVRGREPPPRGGGLRARGTAQPRSRDAVRRASRSARAGNRTWRSGTRWKVAPEATLGLEATRQEQRNSVTGENAILLRGQVRW